MKRFLFSSVKRLSATASKHCMVFRFSKLTTVLFAMLIGFHSGLTAQVNLQLSSPTVSACGNTVDFDVVVTNGFNNLLAVQYSLNWNPADFQFHSTVSSLTIDGDAPLIGDGSALTNLGILTYNWVESMGSADNVPDGTVLLTVRFTAIGVGPKVMNISGIPVTLIAVNDLFEEVSVSQDNQLVDVSEIVAQNGNLQECSGNGNSVIADFKLSDADAEVLGALAPASHTVSYYNSPQEALSETNPLNKVTYIAPTSNVWARVEANATGCFGISLVQLTVLSAPSFTINATHETCNGADDGILHAIVTGSNAAGPWDYQWYDNTSALIAQTLNSNNKTNSVTGLADGAYDLVVTDDNGCSNELTMNVSAGPSLIVTALPDLTVCPGGSVNPVELSATPKSLAVAYSWSGGAAAGLADGMASQHPLQNRFKQ
jgi:hypothetical protein